MEASLVHTCPDTFKTNPFNRTLFKRWQEKVLLTIDVVNLGHILIDLKPKDDYEIFLTWETRNKQVRHTILSTLTNEFLMFTANTKLKKIFGMQCIKNIFWKIQELINVP